MYCFRFWIPGNLWPFWFTWKGVSKVKEWCLSSHLQGGMDRPQPGEQRFWQDVDHPWANPLCSHWLWSSGECLSNLKIEGDWCWSMQVDKIDPQSAGRGLLVLFTALLFRMIGVVFAVSGGNLNKKEKIFMAFAWLPKAAVQVSGVGDYYEWWKCFCRR